MTPPDIINVTKTFRIASTNSWASKVLIVNFVAHNISLELQKDALCCPVDHGQSVFVRNTRL